MNLSEHITGLTIAAAIFALLLTLVGVMIAKKVVKNQSDNEPWSLTNLENDLWLLKRKSHTLATINAIIVEEPEHIDTPPIEGEGFSFMNPSNEQTKYLKYGTSILMRIDPDLAGATMILYYEEHRKQSKEPHAGYQPDMTLEGGEISSSNVQSWRTSLS